MAETLDDFKSQIRMLELTDVTLNKCEDCCLCNNQIDN